MELLNLTVLTLNISNLIFLLKFLENLSRLNHLKKEVKSYNHNIGSLLKRFSKYSELLSYEHSNIS